MTSLPTYTLLKVISSVPDQHGIVAGEEDYQPTAPAGPGLKQEGIKKGLLSDDAASWESDRMLERTRTGDDRVG
jgi:hypothetical protein